MKIFYLVYFFIFYVFKVMEAGWGVALQILSGSRGNRGLLIEYRPALEKEWHLVLLFNLISMTPGSLSVDISEKNDTILVHLLNRDDEVDFRELTAKLERLLKKSF